MLFIGDIHIYPRYTHLTLETLRGYIDAHPTEQHIIFVGDYVYHFSYHRPSLFALLDYFIELAQSGKYVTVLAGNHDRLGQHFVYTEAQKIIQHADPHHRLQFVTEPCFTTIEGQTILLFPYHINRGSYLPKQASYPFEITQEPSSHPNITQSYHLNACLYDMLQTQPSDDPILVIHHYYIAHTVFPGLKTSFSYKDIALSPYWLDDSRITLLSGHIHHCFSYKNYLCIGAVRSTSPLETNQCTYLFTGQNRSFVAQQIAINPYLTITKQEEKTITSDDIISLRSDIQIQSESQLSASDTFIITTHCCELPRERSTLTITQSHYTYDQLEQCIDPSIQDQLRTITLKQAKEFSDDQLLSLGQGYDDFSSGWSNWKQLLNDYLKQKFGDRHERYTDLLQELGIST